MKKLIFSLLGLVILNACSSAPPVKPAADNVKVSRDNPAKNCKTLGDVEGRVKNIKGDFDEALTDLKLDAARKGANFVQIQQTGAHGQSIRGEAYICM